MTKEELQTLGLTEEQISTVWEKLGKEYVPKQTFNEKNDAYKELKKTHDEMSTTLESLKQQATTEDFKKQIEDLKTKHQQAIQDLTITNAIDLALTKEKGRNLTAIKALLNKDAITLDTTGAINGLEDEIKRLKESDGYLFDTTPQTPSISGLKPRETPSSIVEDTSLIEQINKAFNV